MNTANFATRLVAWQRQHGRHGLPWQGQRDPYRVWLSEIMLQQTQVQTVSAYYPRFLARFPDVQALAEASSDEVMQLWSGLGYYSRARNLHRAAQQVVREFGGQWPTCPQALQSLPGIGRSTAHAIAAFCSNARVSICDANVQRVVARYLGFEADLASASALRQLWQLADGLLPGADAAWSMPAYTQGLMDLGATVCTPRQPQCGRCPVAGDCCAHRNGQVQQLPLKTRKLKRSEETWYWLVQATGPLCEGQTRLWLHKRPERGIWAQLHCFEVLHSPQAVEDRAAALALRAGAQLQWQTRLRHILTHKDLWIIPVVAPVEPTACQPAESARWVAVADILAGQVATPAPLLAWLRALQ